MNLKLLNPAREKTPTETDVISARKATALLGVSNHVFINAVDSGLIKAHQFIQKDPRPDYGFSPEYIEEIRKVLLKASRAQGRRVFSDDLKAQIQTLNKKWFTESGKPRL